MIITGAIRHRTRLMACFADLPLKSPTAPGRPFIIRDKTVYLANNIEL